MRRIWGVRHIRFVFWSAVVHRHARRMHKLGLGLGFPNDCDLEHLRRIRDGEA